MALRQGVARTVVQTLRGERQHSFGGIVFLATQAAVRLAVIAPPLGRLLILLDSEPPFSPEEEPRHEPRA